MTMEREANWNSRFVPVMLPWLIALAGFIVYLLTLNHWVSLDSLLLVSRTAGWTWQPDIYGPVFWLVTYPISWLPTNLVPPALNLLTAAEAALTLALLARSVALLPHDRTHEQRIRERNPFSLLSLPSAWIAPVFAAIVCGLQLTFWEHATAASREMLDLLLFAYAIRCLLEFRIDERASWLTRASLVYAAAMTDNWVMIGFFPAFLVAVAWIKGRSFFDLQFLGSMFLWGLAGLAFYLLLPLVQSLADIGQIPFWLGLKANLVGQKNAIQILFQEGRQAMALLSLTSFLPVLIIGIRWSSFSGDTSKLGAALGTTMLHVVHGLFLLACIWVALDPPFSPRNKAFGVPFLTSYYLGALSVGYFSGYLLLVFSGKPAKPYRTAPSLPLIDRAITGIVWLLLLLTPALLVYRNLPQIRLTNGPMLRRFADAMAEGLPDRGAVVLSDDMRRLLLMQSIASQSGRDSKWMFLDTTSLCWPDYHRYLRRKLSDRWPWNVRKDQTRRIEDAELIQALVQLAQTNSLFYLHPSFGYYFEVFYPEAHGLTYQLKFYPTNALITPVPSDHIIGENEAFWNKAESQLLNPILRATRGAEAATNPLDQLFNRAHLPRETNRTALVLAGLYSRALDFWGVELQKAGRMTNAAARFAQALAINPDNIVAQINYDCNQSLQAGQKPSTQLPKAIEDEFGKYRNWDQVVGENGPFDEPNFCYEQGRAFVRGKNYRQAALQFERVKALAPDNLPARLWLAHLFVESGLPDPALKIIGEIHAQAKLLGVSRTNQPELLQVEASAHFLLKDTNQAHLVINRALEQDPQNEDLLMTAAEAYLKFGHYTNAIALVDRELKISPDNQNALLDKGYAYLQMNAYKEAIPPLSRALELETNNFPAMLNRAIAYLRTDQLDAAQADYETLAKQLPKAYQVYYGLGEIAWRRRDTNAAVRYYELYLTNSAPNSAETKQVGARLAELKSGSR